jgi:hypothetical protein
MISSEVQRTLVKSPPELWAELSDPAALARHLGELGEIHITRTEPEKTVEWEAENTTGTVSIQPSGWGTKVTLSVAREVVGPQIEAQAPAEAEDATEVMAAETQAPVARNVEVEADDTAAKAEMVAGEAEPDASSEPATTTAALDSQDAEPEPRRGFFARLFGRRRKNEAAARSPREAASAFAAVREALAPESFAAIDPFALVPVTQSAPQDTPHEPESGQEPDAQPAQIVDISAELRAAEEVTEEEVTAVLVAVLDRLGAAHHRPFSRS